MTSYFMPPVRTAGEFYEKVMRALWSKPSTVVEPTNEESPHWSSASSSDNEMYVPSSNSDSTESMSSEIPLVSDVVDCGVEDGCAVKNEMYVPSSNSDSAESMSCEIPLVSDVVDHGAEDGCGMKNDVDEKEAEDVEGETEAHTHVEVNVAVVGQTDVDDSDDLESESESEDEDNRYDHWIPLGFFLQKGQSMICMYGNIYRAGFLDLTYAEMLELEELKNGAEVQLNIHHSCIKVDNHNVLDIERFRDRDFGFSCVLAKYRLPIWEQMVRIELSMTNPLMARYENAVYMVGKQLLKEYRNLTKSSQIPFGVNILRLYKNRLIIDNESRSIDVSTTNTYEPGKVCFVNGSFRLDRKFLEKFGQRTPELKRYVINSSWCHFSMEKVDPRLVFSSKFDDCSEIYAENDFLFTKLSPEELRFFPASWNRANKYSRFGSSTSNDRTTSWVNQSNNGADQVASSYKPRTRSQGIRSNTPSTSSASETSRDSSPSTSSQWSRSISPSTSSQGSRSISPITSASTQESRSTSPTNSIVCDIPSINGFDFLDNFNELGMNQLKKCPETTEINDFERNNVDVRELEENPDYRYLFDEKIVRKDQQAYIFSHRIMIALDKEAQTMYLEQFNCEVKLVHHMDMRFFFAVPDGLYGMIAAIDENDLSRFILTPTNSEGSTIIMGNILYVQESHVYIKILPHCCQSVLNTYKDDTFILQFQINQTAYELQHMALDYVEEHKLFNKLVNPPAYTKWDGNKCAKQPRPIKLEYHNTMYSELNYEQQNTVRNILSKTDNLPYILYGPPGTGKTRTIVGAIEQIVRTTTTNVLVCAISNSACDEIAERLAGALNHGEIFRMYAKTYRQGGMSDAVKSISNWNRDYIRLPALEDLYKFRVICTTVATAGCFTRARIDSAIWRADHFGYVFIDECASASETMTWIPIAGLCTSKSKVHAKIILAGDPKQLGAVTRSKISQKLESRRSWLERLCTFRLYKPKNGKFDENFISMLVKNYRSHPSILRVSNKLFYHGKLEALASEDIINRYINSDILPSKDFPIIFKSVQGDCRRSGSDTSLSNDTEVAEVVKYAMKLLYPSAEASNMPPIRDTDIGVTSPYKKQCRQLAQRFRELSLNGITVGTTEVFQGKEKPVMIVSTVRTGGSGLGFVSERRRFNVIMTRAKSLLIVVGDPFALCEDKYWRELLKLCLDNNGFIQSAQPFAL